MVRNFKTACFSCLAIALPAALPLPALAETPCKHVLILTADGLHEADLADPALAADIPVILSLAARGAHYTHASCPIPSDSFPGSIALFTGATPKTTGIYFDSSYARSLLPPGAAKGSPLGASVLNTNEIDLDTALLNGGGNNDASSLDPTKMAQSIINGAIKPVYPHNYLKVNTIFEVVHAAGLRTALIEKHPAYEVAAGPSGTGLDDLFGPESDAKVGLIDGKLVSADDPLSKGTKLKKPSKGLDLSQGFDDLRLAALLNQIAGKTSRGNALGTVPALFAMNFIAINTAQKLAKGGIDVDAQGNEIISQPMHLALQHLDASIGKILAALSQQNLTDSTMIIFSAKHGQGQRIGSCVLLPEGTFTAPLENAAIPVAHATQDDVALFWLRNQKQTGDAVTLLTAASQSHPQWKVDQIIHGKGLTDLGLGDPQSDDRAPDIIITFHPGIVVSASNKRTEHGGFSEDDRHVPLIVVAPNIPPSTQDSPVMLTQVAVTALRALGLNPQLLEGAKAEHTQMLPGTFNQ